jgi:hypothetical protein
MSEMIALCGSDRLRHTFQKWMGEKYVLYAIHKGKRKNMA